MNPDELTGDYVRRVREHHHVTLKEFKALAGLPGASEARLWNIEKNDSWKPGDREKVAAAIEELERNPGKGGSYGAKPYATTRDWAQAALHDFAPPAPNVPDDQPAIDATDVDDDDLWTEAEPVGTSSVEHDDDHFDESGFFLRGMPTRQAREAPPIDVIDDDDEDLLDADVITLEHEDDQPTPDYTLSNSEHQTWKRCRRKWWLAWYRKLTPRTDNFASPRATGDRVHRALAMWYVADPAERVDPRDALERIIVEDWTTLSRQLQERDVPEDQMAGLMTRYHDATMLERVMVEGYVQWLEETGVDAELTIVGSEQPISADLDVAGAVVRVVGRLDARVVRAHDKVRLFIDHKTVGDLASPQATLLINEQMLEYMLLEWLNTGVGEARCDGALYNMMRRVKRTAAAHPPFYQRVEVHHNETELETFRTRLLGAAYDMMQATAQLDAGVDPMKVAYPSPRRECSYDCDFLPVCHMLNDKHSHAEIAIEALYQRTNPLARYGDLT